MGNPIRVGLVGLGFAMWELKHPAYQAFQDIQIVAVSDPRPESRAEAVRNLNLPPARCFADYRQMLGQCELDFIDISTPHRTHLEIVRAAAEAHVSLVCDKPLAMTLAEADEMIGVTERAGVVAGIHHNWLW
jgi:predicted dehydrogenase